MQAKEVAVLRDRLRASRAERISSRLLGGAGTASLTAYRLDGQPSLASLSHGVADDGTLVVAAVEPRNSEMFGATPLVVRLDITREAPELEVRIVAATVHLLGSLRWMDDSWHHDASMIERLPEHVAEIALAPGGRLGVVNSASLLVHEAAGVTRVQVVKAIEGALSLTGDRLSAEAPALLDLAMTTDRDRLSLLVDAVIGGYRRGYVLSEKSTAALCGGVLGKTFVVDVDAAGITLLHVGQTKTTVVLALFGAEAPNVEQTTTVDRCRAGLARLFSV